MPSTLEVVLENIIAQIKADAGVLALLSKGSGGEYPVFHARQKKKDVYPRITVMDVSIRTEVSGLGDGYDGEYSYDWNTAMVQVDIYSSRDSTERDRIWTVTRQCLLKKTVKATLRALGIILVQQPSTLNVDNLNASPPEYRKMMTYMVEWFGRA